MKKFMLLGSALLSVLTLFANVRLPKIFSSNMVLQRDKPLKVWGWASPGERVTVMFNGQMLKAKAGKDSSWQVTLKPMQFGGPYEMTVKGKNSISLSNVLIGDVWVCSGQSNMEWNVQHVNNAKDEMAASAHPGIRIITVSKATSFNPENDILSGEWKECGPGTIAEFSAVAYFFGRKLNQDLNVPIGLINTSWGGTVIQAWTSWDLMKQDENFKGQDLAKIEEENAGMNKRTKEYTDAMLNDPGEKDKWYNSNAGDPGWKTVQLPQVWEHTSIGNTDGIIWFKKEFALPESEEGKPITIHLGPIDDSDVTWLNGHRIGATNFWAADRVYQVDPSFLKKGKNTIVVKVLDTGGEGGLSGTADQVFVEAGTSGANSQTNRISLAGEWLYKPSVSSMDYGIRDVGPNGFPSQLYNAMINPLINYSIKGAIWYQGESNVGEAYKYRKLFPQMINDWRNRWHDDFPFLWVQIANLNPASAQPVGSNQAELREAQHMTLALPKTAEAVTIDIGEALDIHPRNKQDVGKRLGLAAERMVYSRDSIGWGPEPGKTEISNNRVIIHFKNTGAGLMVKDKYGYVRGFAIAGEDQHFSWAWAKIEGDSVIVWSDTVTKPVAVRYGWSDNPEDANLYNKEGFPASPFRTDQWKGVTEH